MLIKRFYCVRNKCTAVAFNQNSNKCNDETIQDFTRNLILRFVVILKNQ